MPPSEKVFIFKKNKLEIGILLTILAIAVVIGFVYYQDFKKTLAEQKKIELKLLADNIASDHEGSIFGIRQFLITSGYLAEGLQINSGKCAEILQRMYVVYPYFLNIGITDEDGNVVCSGVSIDRSVNIAEDSDFQEAKNTKSFTVSGYRISTHTGRPSVRFLQPIIDDSDFSGVIFITFGTDWLNGFSPSFDLPEKTTVTKFDTEGVIFMRYPNPLTWNGTDQHDSELFQSIKINKIGFFSSTGLDGKQRLYYFRPIYQDGKIHAYVAISSSESHD